jgi:cytidylate kinase
MSIVAISRGTFTGGEGLARHVSEKLGYQCLSREANLDVAANRYGIPTEQLTETMEKRPSFWDRVIGERAAYLIFVRAALCERACQDRLVYHGYLGQLLLPGISHVIGVRVIADMEFRVQAAMRQQDLDRRGALAYVERVDRERREWTRFLFGVDWDDPRLYALVLNLSRVSLDTACETVARLTEWPEFQPTPASMKAMRDLTLHSRVSAALAMDFRTRGADLKVTADDGIVTITGTTRWSEVAEAAPAVARRIEGVKEVRSEITGGTPPPPLTWY